MNKQNEEIEYEKMIIKIPKNAVAVVATTLAVKNGKALMSSDLYDTQDIQECKIEE